LRKLRCSSTGDEIDKFAHCHWRAGPEGAPVLEACRNWFAGRIRGRVDLGDHVGFLLEPEAGEKGEDQEEFTFHRAKVIEAGHEA
jgi:flavin reductase (DIM6/NTAB) family NADH-FMN oxidoreductase RutF